MRIRKHNPSCRNNQKGVALIIVLLMVLLLSALAAGIAFVTNTEIASTANYRQLAQARYVAEGGAQATVNWLTQNMGTPDITQFDTSKYPVALSGKSCTASDSSGCVYLSFGSGTPTADYPDPNNTIVTSFQGYLDSTSNGTHISGLGGGITTSYTITAQLMSLRQVAILGSNIPGYVQSWKITSTANVNAFRSAQTRVRMMVEKLINPTAPYAAEAFSHSCSAVTFSGANTITNSYDSSQGPYSNTNSLPTMGSVFSNGSVSVGQGTVDGNDQWANADNNCNAPSGSGAGTVTTAAIKTPPAHVPDFPSPAPTLNDLSGPDYYPSPGTYYNDVSFSGGTMYIQSSGIYYFNSLSMSGQAQLVVAPNVQVVFIFNSAGSGFSITGQGVQNVGAGDSPANFQLVYGGTSTCTVTGNGTTQSLAYAPNAEVDVKGNGDFMGAVVANTVNLKGNGAIHFDRNLQDSAGTLTPFITTAFSWEKSD